MSSFNKKKTSKGFDIQKRKGGAFDEMIDQVIEESDIVMLIVDARRIFESINGNIQDKVRKKNKKLLYVINKVDMISKEQQDAIKLRDSIMISAKRRIGTMRLLRKLMEISKGKDVVIGVIGLPNTGKSTIINALKGRHSAPTSKVSGFTKALQKIRINKSMMLIDTPGVFPYSPSNNINFVLMGALDSEKVKDPEKTAVRVIEAMEGKVEKFFGVERNYDEFETLEAIAIKKKMLKKGGVPDTYRMARMLIKMCQDERIK